MTATKQAYKTIIVGIDLSDDSFSVLKRAELIAHQNTAQMHVVHVLEPIAFTYGGDVPIDIIQAQKVIEENAKKRLFSIIEQSSVNATSADIVIGSTTTQLHQFAQDKHANLIIVGSHGRHGLALLLGSTANGVLHGAKTDVLAVILNENAHKD